MSSRDPDADPDPRTGGDLDLEPGDEYGSAIGLTRDGDLLINDLRRPQMIHDSTAVIQDLKVQLLTIRGEDPMRPDYGLDVFAAVGGTADPDTFRAEVRRAIGPDADPRVEQIPSIEIEEEGRQRDNVAVHITVDLVDGTTRTFEFSPRQRVFRE